jgi:DNA-binding NarL/FixJ family response regulator
MEEDVKRSMQAGFEQHLTKPIRFSALTDAIQAVLASSSSQSAATMPSSFEPESSSSSASRSPPCLSTADA